MLHVMHHKIECDGESKTFCNFFGTKQGMHEQLSM